jgi:hypothetical protein
MACGRQAFQHFRDAAPGAGARSIRQRLHGEEARLGDFEAAAEGHLREFAQHETGHMVAPELTVVEEQAVKLRLLPASIPASSLISRIAASTSASPRSTPPPGRNQPAA